MALVMKMIDFRFQAPDLHISHFITRQPSQKNFFMHTHVYAELYCFLGGKATFYVEGTAYPLQPGDILLMRPAEAHYVQIDPSVPYERICMNFDPGILATLDPQNQLEQLFFGHKAGKQNHYRPKDEQCLQYLHRMVTPAQGQRLVILGNLILLLQQLSELFSGEQPPSDDPGTLEYLLIRYINKNLDKDLSIQSLCDRFFISRTQLCQRFRQATGTSVGNYITVKRLLLARQLLLQKQKPTEVFSVCGYQDYSSFYRAYTAYFGHSPRDARQACFPALPEDPIIIG